MVACFCFYVILCSFISVCGGLLCVSCRFLTDVFRRWDGENGGRWGVLIQGSVYYFGFNEGVSSVGGIDNTISAKMCIHEHTEEKGRTLEPSPPPSPQSLTPSPSTPPHLSTPFPPGGSQPLEARRLTFSCATGELGLALQVKGYLGEVSPGWCITLGPSSVGAAETTLKGEC